MKRIAERIANEVICLAARVEKWALNLAMWMLRDDGNRLRGLSPATARRIDQMLEKAEEKGTLWLAREIQSQFPDLEERKVASEVEKTAAVRTEKFYSYTARGFVLGFETTIGPAGSLVSVGWATATEKELRQRLKREVFAIERDIPELDFRKEPAWIVGDSRGVTVRVLALSKTMPEDELAAVELLEMEGFGARS